MLLLFLACAQPAPTPATDSGTSSARPWAPGLPDAASLDAPRGWQTLRTITHLHSPWSHDACDGEPLIGGEPDQDCLADLRAGLCALQVDVAYLSDHPSHAAGQPFEALLHLRDQDTLVEDGGRPIGAWMACAPDGDVLLRPGIEGGLMPLGLHQHAEDVDTYGERSEAAAAQQAAAGALVFTAHTEGRTLDELQALREAGLGGVEVFNIHAMFDPNIRQDDLGLGALDWLSAIAPFTSPDGTAEPDLLFLGVLQEQAPSVSLWDALQTDGAVVGVGGSDAHQNVFPALLRDGERGDSYRRMLKWMSNHLLAEDRSAQAADEALAAGRLAVVFEVLGSPSGMDFSLDTGGAVVEMGGRTGQGGQLRVGCPRLSADSPQGEHAPEIRATVFKDGVPWQDGCGTFEVTEPGVYRARFDIVPWHLAPFLGDDPDPWLVSWPWVYTNPITVTE